MCKNLYTLLLISLVKTNYLATSLSAYVCSSYKETKRVKYLEVTIDSNIKLTDHNNIIKQLIKKQFRVY